jgi:hypothetical protein
MAQRLELRHRYLQLFESYQADQIQRCTTVDKDVVELDVDDGRGDKQRELPSLFHALRAVRGIEVDRCLHLPVVWGHPWGKRGRRHLSVQVLDDATGGDIPRASEHNVERLATLVVTRLGVTMAIYGFEVPFGFLKPILSFLSSSGSEFCLPSHWREGAPSPRCCFSCLWYCSTSFLISRHSSALWRMELCTGQHTPLSSLLDA